MKFVKNLSFILLLSILASSFAPVLPMHLATESGDNLEFDFDGTKISLAQGNGESDHKYMLRLNNILSFLHIQKKMCEFASDYLSFLPKMMLSRRGEDLFFRKKSFKSDLTGCLDSMALKTISFLICSRDDQINFLRLSRSVVFKLKECWKIVENFDSKLLSCFSGEGLSQDILDEVRNHLHRTIEDSEKELLSNVLSFECLIERDLSVFYEKYKDSHKEKINGFLLKVVMAFLWREARLRIFKKSLKPQFNFYIYRSMLCPLKERIKNVWDCFSNELTLLEFLKKTIFSFATDEFYLSSSRDGKWEKRFCFLKKLVSRLDKKRVLFQEFYSFCHNVLSRNVDQRYKRKASKVNGCYSDSRLYFHLFAFDENRIAPSMIKFRFKSLFKPFKELIKEIESVKGLLQKAYSEKALSVVFCKCKKLYKGNVFSDSIKNLKKFGEKIGIPNSFLNMMQETDEDINIFIKHMDEVFALKEDEFENKMGFIKKQLGGLISVVEGLAFVFLERSIRPDHYARQACLEEFTREFKRLKLPRSIAPKEKVSPRKKKKKRRKKKKVKKPKVLVKKKPYLPKVVSPGVTSPDSPTSPTSTVLNFFGASRETMNDVFPEMEKGGCKEKRKKVAKDGSCLVEETQSYVKIHDPKNKVFIVLYKVQEKPVKSFDLSFCKRVEECFYNEDAMVRRYNPDSFTFVFFDENDGEHFISDRAEKVKILSIHHSFAKLVDEYIFELGFKTMWKCGKTGRLLENINIPGEIIFEDGKKREYGVFTYGFVDDFTGRACNHRCFSDMPRNKLLSDRVFLGCWNVHLRDESGNEYDEFLGS